jgi:hypothetical protein
MRQVGVILALVIGVGFASAAASEAAATRPTLRLVDRAPVVIRGAAFAPRERVTVVLAAGSRSSSRVLANANGAFVARFRLALGRCTRYSVQAFGSRGSRARLMPSRVTVDCIPGDGWRRN